MYIHVNLHVTVHCYVYIHIQIMPIQHKYNINYKIDSQ
jgi:hypothetical protein